MEPQVTVEQLKWFESNEGKLFSRLVIIDFQQGGSAAWQVITLWVWLADLGIPNIMVKLLAASNAVIRFLSKETLICLECIKTGRILDHPLNEMPFMQMVTNKAISLQILNNNRRQVLEGMLRVTENICARRFVDIELQSVASAIQPAMSQIRDIAINLATQQAMTPLWSRPIWEATQNVSKMVPRSRAVPSGEVFNMSDDNRERLMIKPYGEGSSKGSYTEERQTRAFGEAVNKMFDTTRPKQTIPYGEGRGFVGGSREKQMNQALSTAAETNLCAMMSQWNIKEREEDKSMFMTFSRGYPVSAFEVLDFLTKLHGDCVESIYMQEVVPQNVQSLFALVVFKQGSTLETILNGQEKVNFNINGKHAKARRWEPK